MLLPQDNTDAFSLPLKALTNGVSRSLIEAVGIVVD